MTVLAGLEGAAKLAAAQFKPHTGESLRRLNICNQCTNNQNGRCALCGCFVDSKVKFESEFCPDNPRKW